MAQSLTGYYGRAKTGISSIDPGEMEELGMDYLVVAATGAGVALTSNIIGGLDKQVLGVPVPIDGLISVGLGVAGLMTHGPMGNALKVASVAAGGSAAVRTFEGLFKKMSVRGEFDELAFDRLPVPGYEGTYGPNTFAFGQGAQDRLVQAARYL